MSNYEDFAVWAASAASGGGKVIQVREDNKTAKIPYKLFSGQTKSFYLTSPKGSVIECSEDGSNWRTLTVGRQSRFFDVSDGLYLNGSLLTYEQAPASRRTVNITSGTGVGWYDENGDYFILQTSSDTIYKWDRVNEEYVSITWRLNDSTYQDMVYNPINGSLYGIRTWEGTDLQVWNLGDVSPGGGTTTFDRTLTYAGYSISAIDVYAGDVYLYDANTGIITQFDQETTTVLNTVNIGIDAAGNKAFSFDLKGNLMVVTNSGSDNLTVYDGFSTSILYTRTIVDGISSTVDVKMRVSPVTGEINIGLCVSGSSSVSGNYSYVINPLDSSVSKPAILLVEEA